MEQREDLPSAQRDKQIKSSSRCFSSTNPKEILPLHHELLMDPNYWVPTWNWEGSTYLGSRCNQESCTCMGKQK